MWKVQGHSEDRHGNYPIVIELVFLHQAIVIQKVLEVFPFYLNFLDGDILFRQLHSVVDIFVDENKDLSVLTGKVA